MELTQEILEDICIEVQEEFDHEFGVGPYSIDSLETRRGDRIMLGSLAFTLILFTLAVIIYGV